MSAAAGRAISTSRTLGHPGKYTYAVAENEAGSPWAPYHVEKGFPADDSTVFVIAAEPPHSVTNHVANDPEGILDSICSAMSTIANNNAVSSGHCAVVIGPEHARTIAAKGWTRHDVRSYLPMNAHNLFRELAFNHRYGRIYNRNLPHWYSREPESRIPVVPGPEHIHLFVIGGEAGRFSAFIPGWGHMSSPVLRSIEGGGQTRRRSASTAPAICDKGDFQRMSKMTAREQIETFDPRGVVDAERLAPAPRVGRLDRDAARRPRQHQVERRQAAAQDRRAARRAAPLRHGQLLPQGELLEGGRARAARGIAADNDIVLTAIGD